MASQPSAEEIQSSKNSGVSWPHNPVNIHLVGDLNVTVLVLVAEEVGEASILWDQRSKPGDLSLCLGLGRHGDDLPREDPLNDLLLTLGFSQ